MFGFEVKNGNSQYTTNQAASGLFDSSLLGNGSDQKGGVIDTSTGKSGSVSVQTGNPNKLSALDDHTSDGCAAAKGSKISMVFSTLWYNVQ